MILMFVIPLEAGQLLSPLRKGLMQANLFKEIDADHCPSGVKRQKQNENKIFFLLMTFYNTSFEHKGPQAYSLPLLSKEVYLDEMDLFHTKYFYLIPPKEQFTSISYIITFL